MAPGSVLKKNATPTTQLDTYRVELPSPPPKKTLLRFWERFLLCRPELSVPRARALATTTVTAVGRVKEPDAHDIVRALLNAADQIIFECVTADR